MYDRGNFELRQNTVPVMTLAPTPTARRGIVSKLIVYTLRLAVLLAWVSLPVYLLYVAGIMTKEHIQQLLAVLRLIYLAIDWSYVSTRIFALVMALIGMTVFIFRA